MASAARAHAQFNPWLNSSKIKFKTKLFLFPKILRNISRIFWLYRSFAKLSKCAKCFEIIFFFFAKLVFNLYTDSGSVHLLLLYSVHPTYGQLFVVHCAILTMTAPTVPFWQRQLPPAEVPPELKINENSKAKKRARVFVVVVRWCSSLSQRHFKLDNYVYSVGVKTTEMLYLVQ